MGGLTLNPVFFIVVMTILTLIGSFGKSDFSDQARKKQAKREIDETSGILDSVKKYTDEKVKFSARAELEKLCRQAGMSWTYAHYFLARIVCAAGLMVATVFTQNIFLAVVMAGVGFVLPKQYIVSRRNKRVDQLENQIGPFLQMVTTRYLSSKDFEKSLKLTRDEFKGMEPIYTELKLTTAEIDSKVPIGDALDHMADRCENKFIARFADYYKIASSIGTKEARENLLGQAYLQFEEERKLRAMLKREITEPKRDAYICMASIPLFMLFGIFALQGYWEFITQEFLGKILVAATVLICLVLVWFINNKIAAPLR